MSRALLVAGAVGVMSAAAFFTPVLANPAAGLSAADPVPQSLIVKTGPFHCLKWNEKCRNRWGFGWRYRRCMNNHGC